MVTLYANAGDYVTPTGVLSVPLTGIAIVESCDVGWLLTHGFSVNAPKAEAEPAEVEAKAPKGK